MESFLIPCPHTKALFFLKKTKLFRDIKILCIFVGEHGKTISG